jgi:TRAP-type mannitol/chloroaromatic compound transport system permease small subunit
MAWLSVSSGEYSQSTWGPPVWPVRLTIPLGALLILLQGVTKYIRVIITVVTGKEVS